MKIKVERSGGIAAVTRVWTVDARTDSDLSQWQPLVEACPWDSVPSTPRAAAAVFDAPQPDRFLYAITAGQRRAALRNRPSPAPGACWLIPHGRPLSNLPAGALSDRMLAVPAEGSAAAREPNEALFCTAVDCLQP